MSNKKRSRVHPKYKTKYRVRNWKEYDKALVSRGDLTIWFNEDAVAAWEPEPSGERGRPQSYSMLAIETALALRLVYSLPWRQTEGLLGSVIGLMGLEIGTPDHTTLSRRARSSRIALASPKRSGPLHLVVDATGLKVFGQGEWAAWKHGASNTGPGWRKLHIGVDEDGFIVAAKLTDASITDAATVPDLLAQLDRPVASFTADGAYDGRPVYEALLAAGSAPRIVSPPIRTAKVAGPSEPTLTQRNAAIESIGREGRRQWKKAAGYHQQARAENGFSRYKRIIGPSLRARCDEGQNMEVKVACVVLNRMSSLGLPDSVAILVA
ncbi:MAG: IS5 family transposase [Myxococcales bacterium]|nr:IS5 family transposase [Myxococcales bacterium]